MRCATDYHEEARNVALELKSMGLDAEASALVDAIEPGSTGTEILMASRWHLERIDTSAFSSQLGHRVDGLREAIETALGANG